MNEQLTSGQFIHSTADIEPKAQIGQRVCVWHYAHIREDALIGDGVSIGRGAYIGPGARIEAFAKIQNYAQLFEPVVVGRGAFIGPGAILTNDRKPRSVTPEGRVKGVSDWQPSGVTVDEGASVGAGAICVGPLTIGAWAMVGAGSVVTRDVRPYALVVGNPAKQIGWVGEDGHQLVRTSPHGMAWASETLKKTYLVNDSGKLEAT